MIVSLLILPVAFAVATAGTSYQHVQFFGDGSKGSLRKIRPSRSYHYGLTGGYSPEALWPEGLFIPPTNLLNVEINENQHITPDFSNGLEYPDPYLLTGEAAKSAAKYIYGKGEMFFSRYPHVRALLRKQQERRENGLDGHRLGSLRPLSPFYRDRLAREQYFI